MAERKERPVHVSLAQRLGTDIVTGVVQPGALLPGELELASRFAVSRSVIRESLRMLAAKGLVESRTKVGTWVRKRQSWNLLDPELLGWMFEGEPSPAVIRGLFQLRLIVEPAAAELAATSRTPKQIAGMGHALELMEQFGLADDRGRAADNQFHSLVLQATGNEMLVSLSASIAAAVRWTTIFKYRHQQRPRNPIDEHHLLFGAICEADSDAAGEAARKLIKLAERDMEDAMGLRTETPDEGGAPRSGHRPSAA